MDDGYHVVSIPAYHYDKLLSNTAFADAWQARCVAKTVSYYNHKTTQVIYCEKDTRDLVWAFMDGEEIEWF